MRDTELYATLLGLKAPWHVSEVKLELADRVIHVSVNHGEAQWECPECGEARPLYDHAEERVWRHLDTMQYVTMLHAQPPRIRCREHGVKSVRLPWAEPGSRFTLLFERLAIEILQQTSVEAGRKLLRISWDEAWKIQERAVERGQKRKGLKVPKYLGVDEKAFSPGQGAYVTIVCDLEGGTVEWVGQDRTAATLSSYFNQFLPGQLEEIQAVSMDMWRAYSKAVMECLPGAENKIVYDRFHVMKEVNEAVDKVRKEENQELLAGGDERMKGTKYWWLYSAENVPEKFKRMFVLLRNACVQTGRAWGIKEMLRGLWEQKTMKAAIRFWRRWYFWATHSRLKPIISAAKKLNRHKMKLLNYIEHRITNAMAESTNGRIEKLKRVANGYRNRTNFTTALLFHFGGLSLLPDLAH